MFCLSSPLNNKEDFVSSRSCSLGHRKYQRNILKSKENTYKYKCKKAQKRKLKKYKLRHDGVEDPEILNVSEILIKSLNIKSPTSCNNNQSNNFIFDENFPKNYLFKMGRRKQIVKLDKNSKSNSPISSQSVDETNSLPLCNGKEEQQTNAFKLLMDSRNKSLGSNSPGKEKTVDKNEIQESVEKKTIKAKRNLALQKMAEAKGSLEKKEMEEYQEECIKKKMEKRAERLKSMIVSNNSNIKMDKASAKDKKSKPPKDAVFHVAKHKEEPKQKTLTIISLFNDPVVKNNISPEKKVVSKEDNDFLKKLSPSLKKKENMLCYFKKVEKEVPVSIDVENDNSNINDDVVIKVKVAKKLKKKAKKKKSITNEIISGNIPSQNLSMGCSVEISSDVLLEQEQLDSKINKDSRKRKRHDNVDNKILNTNNSQDVERLASESRPKRNIKKPVKYTDDIETFSSDDDLHIFTPKKKRHSENKTPNKQSTIMENTHKGKLVIEINNKLEKTEVPLKIKPTSKGKKSDKGNDPKLPETPKKNVKLAPIFATKPQLDAAAIEAKQKFLHSGVPEKLKKIIADQKNKNTEVSIFPATVHVQQNKNLSLDIPATILWNSLDMSDEELIISPEENLFKNVVSTLWDKRSSPINLTQNYDKHSILRNIKKMYPKFPVFRTYRLLKDKRCGEFKECSYQEMDNSVEIIINGISDIVNENPDKLNWTDKYKATSSKHIIGNFESIRELRKWLITWTENEAKSRNRINFDSDSSDFYQSDTDSKESFKSTNSLLMITGPVGSGKTSSVYAVATELAIKVIEVNASSKRTGKIMLQDLQEATQSHKVNRRKGSAENSQKSQEVFEDSKKPLKKKGRPKKYKETSSKGSTIVTAKNENLSQSQTTNSQESVRTGMSLILIDDADIIFEQDDGFCSAIVQLVQSSKRPVILISSSSSCTHLQRFLQSAKIIKMYPLLPRMLGTWLDIMCLADAGFCVPGTGATILDYFKGDIRKAINSLQFYVSSQIQNEESNSPNSDPVPYMDDENSSMSWADQDITEEKQSSIKSLESKSCKYIIGQQLTLSEYYYPLDLYNIWWSIPTLLRRPKCDLGNRENINNQENSLHTVVELEAIANALDSVSIAEYYRPNKLAKVDTTFNPWFCGEGDSVSETEHAYDYNSNQEVLEEISHRLMSGSILEAQNILQVEKSADMHFPSMTVQRLRDKVVSRHHNLSNCLNLSAVLDRRALALDYWSSCRTICRLEKSKTDNNSKRNNRFCHYLKSLNVMCKTDYFDKLADSLDPSSRFKALLE